MTGYFHQLAEQALRPVSTLHPIATLPYLRASASLPDMPQAVPGLELLAQSVGGTQDALGLARIVPEVGGGGALVERGQLVGLGAQVKDAPKSNGPGTRGHG